MSTLNVTCPGCGTRVEWNDRFPFRPFCSARCKNADFIGWAREEHRIPSDEHSEDELFSEDMQRSQHKS